jgi:selT/selW/selH-like putative selenoprotein
VELAPGYDGRFEVFVDGQRVFSKLEAKRYPELRELLDHVAEKLPADEPAAAR